MSNFWESDPVAVPSKGGSNFWESDPVVAAPEGVTANKIARSAATGVPIIGGLLNRAEAATNATLAPVVEPFLTPSAADISRKGETWPERYAKSKAMQDAADAQMAAEHPIIDTAAKIAGGVAGTIPAMTAAPAAFGLTGTLPQMVARGAASNAALSAADAVARGEDPTTAAAVGGAMGAAAPLVGRGVGKVIQGVKDYRNPPPIVPQNVEKVAGVDIPLSTGQATGHPQTQAEEEIMRRGGRGQSAEEIARQADQQAQAAVSEASGNIGKSLDPTGASLRTAPQDAGATVQSELAQQAQANEAADVAKSLQVRTEGESLARGLGGGAAPVSPLDAAADTGAAVARKAAEAKTGTQAAYKAAYSEPGTLDASVPKNISENIRTRINAGDDPTWVDPDTTSIANSALKELDKTVGKGVFHNFAMPSADANAQAAASRAQKLADDMVAQGIHPEKARASAAAAEGITPEAMDQAAGTAAKPIDLRTMDSARKRLITKYKDAKDFAINSGDKSDLRAMTNILHEFDNVITEAFDSGKFTGDSAKAKELLAAARRSHSEFKQTFSSRGPGDEIGRNIEKILGRYSDSAAAPEEIQKMSYGAANAPGGGPQSRIAERLQKIFGPNSPEYGKYKQGLFDYVLGDESFSPAEKAARIDKFLPGSLAKTALQPAERRALAAHSSNLKGIEPAAKPTDRVGKALARITGADGHPPATSNEVVDTLFSKGAKGNGLSTELALYLKKNLSPESFTALKQGAFEHLVTTAEGAKDLTSAGIAKRLSAYLEGDLSKALNTPEELAEMRKLMLVHNKLTPLPGTTNPSGSAFFGQKMLRSAGRNLMTMLGFAHGGVGGAIVGHGLDSVGGMVKDARAGKEATRLFFGPQAKSPVRHSRIPQLLVPAISASQR